MGILILGIVLRLVLNLNSSIYFSIQKSSINNIIGFISTLLIFLYVTFAKVGTVSSNFIKLSIANAILSNLPLLIGTIYIFAVPFKKLYPSMKFFNKEKAKEILKIGTILLWLQVVFMVISSTHAFLITNFRNPSEVVEYNLYYKIYYGILSLFYLALTPIWSAVTKAQAKKDFQWIYKLYKVLLITTIPFLILNLLTVPFLQKVFDIWLKEKSVTINVSYAIAFVVFNICFAIHNVNTSIFNGLSDFKIQNIWMGFAAIVVIPLCYFLTKSLDSWIGVIIGSFLSIIPYQIIQIVVGMKKLKNNTLSKK
jgi:O-antigen/teichoic acid export membrane protein